MKVFLGLQARSSSARLPKKIFQKIGPKELLVWAYEAAQEAKSILKKQMSIEASVKVIGPENDEELKAFCKSHQFSSVYPKVNQNDLFARYNAAFQEPHTHLVRLTADCWRLDSWLIAACVDLMLSQNLDYVSNTIFRSFEEGKDVQAASLKGWGWMMQNQKTNREHPFMDFDLNKNVRDEFEKAGLKYSNFLNPRFNFLIHGSSINSPEDLELANEVYAKEFGLAEQSKELPRSRFS
jgi:spore coat polysaccharide biosynthesis protein SpsF (cytidylyltransferase family)